VAPGRGKTLSARTYAASEDWERWSNRRYKTESTLPASLLVSRTAMFTPEVAMTARQLYNEVSGRVFTLGGDIERCYNPDWDPFDELPLDNETRTELVIIDLSRPSGGGAEPVRRTPACTTSQQHQPILDPRSRCATSLFDGTLVVVQRSAGPCRVSLSGGITTRRTPRSASSFSTDCSRSRGPR